MKATSRKFLYCMFCENNTNISQEHVWGRSLSKRFPKQPVVRARKSAHSNSMRSGGYTPLSETSWSMCASCNNGLSDEMNIASPIINDLFKGNIYVIEQPHLFFVTRYFQRIGLLMDLECSTFDSSIMTEKSSDSISYQMMHRLPICFSATERQNFMNGSLLPNIHVFLGCHRGRYGEGYVSEFANIILSRGLKGNILKRFVFSIKKITGLICIGNPPFNKNPKLRQLRGDVDGFQLDKMITSRDSDVEKNLNSFDLFLDGSSASISTRRR